MSIMAVLEQSGGAWHRASLQVLAAAQELGEAASRPVVACLLGRGARELAGTMAMRQVSRVVVVEHALLEEYTWEAWVAALEQVVNRVEPSLVLLPHTYQVRDYAPRLATRMGRVLVSDVVAIRVTAEGGFEFSRPLFQGKFVGDYRVAGPPPLFASLQAGAWRAEDVRPGSAPVETFEPALDPALIRSRPEARFREADRAVDLAAAPRIVAVGRGIRDPGNLAMVEELARALDAEMAASRPVCDQGWMPIDRQVGSSGQTVAPKLYLAVGISGAIQHLVGMSGARTVVAINKDPEAPIFEVADYGIVGDLMEVVPALTEEINKLA